MLVVINAVVAIDPRPGDSSPLGRLHRSNPQLSDASAEACSIPVRLTSSKSLFRKSSIAIHIGYRT